ncbi:glutathione S-transferase N-terminal domain-containing protein [Natrialbaceae archaeon GCM10025810]|uniref:glutathione S-transferase N-terminal domain-containing protein n=1 Tax=Halovalidus salilacus TaxID=3075124 RepID=UPI0036159641
MLELYQAEGCPYSSTVREKLTDLGVSYVAHNPRRPEGDVRNERTYRAMQDVGGRDSIPFLVDTDREETIYEGDEIVDYLEEHYA